MCGLRRECEQVEGGSRGKWSSRRDRENQESSESYRARQADSDPVRASPYGPAASGKRRNREAEYTTAPDHIAPNSPGQCLHFWARPYTLDSGRPYTRFDSNSCLEGFLFGGGLLSALLNFHEDYYSVIMAKLEDYFGLRQILTGKCMMRDEAFRKLSVKYKATSNWSKLTFIYMPMFQFPPIKL